jgi:hypothetical protein
MGGRDRGYEREEEVRFSGVGNSSSGVPEGVVECAILNVWKWSGERKVCVRRIESEI